MAGPWDHVDREEDKRTKYVRNGPSTVARGGRARLGPRYSGDGAAIVAILDGMGERRARLNDEERREEAEDRARLAHLRARAAYLRGLG